MTQKESSPLEEHQLSSLHPLEVAILSDLHKQSPTSEADLAAHTGLDPAQVSMSIGWMQAKQYITITSEVLTKVVSLTSVGTKFSEEGSLLERIFTGATEAKQQGGLLTMKTLQETLGLQASDLSGPIGALKTEGSLQIGPGGVLEPTSPVSELTSTLRMLIEDIAHGPASYDTRPDTERKIIDTFSQRRGRSQEPFRVDEHITRSFALTDAGQAIATNVMTTGVKEGYAQLTPEILKDGSWRTRAPRPYNIALRPPRITAGKKHPYRSFLDKVKTTLVSMGFEEMRGPIVESEFWNMDTLYMPQFHPARDIHDVYFVKSPAYSEPIPEPYVSRVSQTHRDGWTTGSRGWRYSFNEQQTRRLVLRSQGTAVSSRTLASQPKIPGKYFSMARCFRYDQIDATHATDFFQTEGIVLGNTINFQTLLGLLSLFAKEMAQTTKVKFAPAYFPFTEPSVELHVEHPKLGWMELGGAGLLRPEVTHPLGIKVPVIAWGLGLDRMAMIALGIHDIRDLFTANLDLIRQQPMPF
ncbi:MAG: phenylalanine--tRNA ligase subunit alpha [Nitrospiraceae bacterium]|nr:phenylalanine--tRNA ligase subunit alpha [Nitrospiraceae bacterium]